MKSYLRETGQGLVEYALIFVLVIIIVIVLLWLFGDALGRTYSSIVNNV